MAHEHLRMRAVMRILVPGSGKHSTHSSPRWHKFILNALKNALNIFKWRTITWFAKTGFVFKFCISHSSKKRCNLLAVVPNKKSNHHLRLEINLRNLQLVWMDVEISFLRHSGQNTIYSGSWEHNLETWNCGALFQFHLSLTPHRRNVAYKYIF